jgi:hypothetical protein
MFNLSIKKDQLMLIFSHFISQDTGACPVCHSTLHGLLAVHQFE